jgi:hypothetical protein
MNGMGGFVERQTLWPAPLAALAIVLADVAYVFALHPVPSSRKAFVAASLAVTASAIVVGFVTRGPRLLTFFLSAGSFSDLAWAFLGVFSIGIFLVPSVILALLAADRASRGLRLFEAWMIVTGAIGCSLCAIAAGLLLTS